jgi:hypothetical protein
MKRFTLAAAALVFAAACAGGDTAATDTATPAMAPAPADSMTDSMRMDTAAADSMAARPDTIR